MTWTIHRHGIDVRCRIIKIHSVYHDRDIGRAILLGVVVMMQIIGIGVVVSIPVIALGGIGATLVTVTLLWTLGSVAVVVVLPVPLRKIVVVALHA